MPTVRRAAGLLDRIIRAARLCDMPPRLIAALRHAEKSYDYQGHEMPGLSYEGQKRASLLARALRPGNLLPADTPVPSRLLVPHYPEETQSKRPWLTLAPLASALTLTPDAVVAKKDVAGLVSAVLADRDGTTVICWEHDCLVAWLHRFAGTVDVTVADAGDGDGLPCEWPGARFDILWLLARVSPEGAQTTAYTFTAPDQRLMPGDKPANTGGV